MAAGPVHLVVGVVAAASALTASVVGTPVAAVPAPAQPVACAAPAAWEADAQRLADALDGVTGDPAAERLRRRLEAAGFVPGGDAASGRSDLAAMVADLLAALTGGDGSDVDVVVIGDGVTPSSGGAGSTGGCGGS